MVGKTCKFNAPCFAVASSGQCYAENFRSLDSIFPHHLIEVAYTEYQYRVRVFLLHFSILLHQRGIRYAFWLLHLIFGDLLCRFGLRRFRGRRCETPIIIEAQIEAQFQRLIKSISHIAGNTFNATTMLVDDSRFAKLVSTYLCLRTDNILRKGSKIFVIRRLGVTVNN